MISRVFYKEYNGGYIRNIYQKLEYICTFASYVFELGDAHLAKTFKKVFFNWVNMRTLKAY